jgi:hypothetical protein
MIEKPVGCLSFARRFGGTRDSLQPEFLIKGRFVMWRVKDSNLRSFRDGLQGVDVPP